MTNRADKQRNIDKVTAELVKHPLATEREIAKMSQISNSTAHVIKKEIKQNQAKDDRILSLTDKDFDLTQNAVQEQLKRLANKPGKISNSDLISMARESSRRYQIFRGNITDKHGGKKTISDVLDALEYDNE